MPDDDSDLLGDLWQKRALFNDFQSFTASWPKTARSTDVAYLKKQHAFLVIANAEVNDLALAREKPVLHQADSKWVIIDDGDQLASSAANYLYRDVADDGSEGDGGGTLVQRAVDTSYAMVMLAQDLGWSRFRIRDGSALMRWAAWMASLDYALPLEGYTATAADQAKRERVLRHLGSRWRQLASKTSLRITR